MKGEAESHECIHAQVAGQPCWRLDIFLVAKIKAHAVGRTVDGLLGVGDIVGIEGCCIDEVGHAARRRHAGLGKARGTIGVATNVTVRHCCITQTASKKIN